MGMVAHSYNTTTQKVEAKGLGVQDQPVTHSKFKARLG